MGKGGEAETDREYTWQDVQSHSKPDNGWIVINDTVYDITRWSRKHPGGARILGHYAGQDATVCATRILFMCFLYFYFL